MREPTIQRQGQTRILVQLPGIDDPDRVKRLIGKTAKMTFHLVDDSANAAEALGGRVPPGDMLLPMVEGRGGQQQRQVLVNKRVLVSGENLLDAEPTFQQNEPVVSFRFDTLGGRRFGEATAQNVGKPFAIVLDGRSSARRASARPSLAAAAHIGQLHYRRGRRLALLLRAGALTAPLTLVEERTVGAGLGADSIGAGKQAACRADPGRRLHGAGLRPVRPYGRPRADVQRPSAGALSLLRRP